jgi:FkbM family methyltransferase
VTGAGGALRRWYRSRRHRRLQRRMAGLRLLGAFADLHPEAFFVEIGANDGSQHDHLRPFIVSRPWRGIMVEPVPYVFARLQRNYAGLDRVTLANVAIADRDGDLPFFHLREEADPVAGGLPDWYDGTGSFSRDGLLRHAAEIPDVEERIVQTAVPALTLASLCRKHDVDRVDLLLLDTEGFDWEILRQVDLAEIHPRLVVYEHFHLSAEDRAACRAAMEAAGYETLEEGFDTFCLDTSHDDGLTRAWRGLRPAVAGVAAYEVAR